MRLFFSKKRFIEPIFEPKAIIILFIFHFIAIFINDAYLYTNAFPSAREREDKKQMFGPHLTMDMYGCNKKKLKDVNFVYNFLSELPEMIGMTKIMPPYTFSYSGVKPEDWGVSGIVLIAESHISVHTFPEKGYASIDIFSCKEFDVESASDIIASRFEAKTYERNFLMRGRHFPKDIARSRQIIQLERESAKAKED